MAAGAGGHRSRCPPDQHRAGLLQSLDQFPQVSLVLFRRILWMRVLGGRIRQVLREVLVAQALMLVHLADAYYYSRKYSEALEIFFEMSKQFPAVRQIQVAMQGVYSMEQKSAGDAKIF